VAAVALLGSTLTSAAAAVGGVIDGQRVGLLIVGMALALGFAWMLARAASGRRANRTVAGTNGLATLPINPAPAADPPLALAADQALAPQYDQIEAQAPLAMMHERWQPRTATATAPASFLDLLEPQAKKPERSRFAVVSTLLVLALVVMLVSGSVLFRRQLINVLAGMDASYGSAAASSGAPLAQPNTSCAAADVGAAAVSVASAPTAAAPAAPTAAAVAAPAAAPAITAEGQGAQKHVKGNGLNLRAQPGIDQQVVAVLRQGDVVTVFTDARLIQGATWVRVRAGDVEGWVDQSFLE
jgi:hypothetical protein